MRYDCVIVGGGIIGLSIGWRAAQLGVGTLVLDRSDPPAGASWVAAGMLAPVTETTFGEEALLRLNLESARRWRGFGEELEAASGIGLGAPDQGLLHVAVDSDQVDALRRLFAYQHDLGLAAQWLSGTRCREMEPGLHPSTRAGILAPGDGAVDPRRVVAGLTRALGAGGGRVRYGCPVTEVIPGEAPEVVLEGGERLQTGTIVLAAGSWTGQLPGVPDAVARAIRPVKGQILRLRPRRNHPVPINRVVRSEDAYLVPRPDGEVVLGATVEEQGFDTSPTAGGVFELLRSGDELVPGIREMELAEVGVGLRPGTPDNAPLLGPAGPGLVAATGHHRNGILLAPVTADGIAALLAKGELPTELAGFHPARFAT